MTPPIPNKYNNVGRKVKDFAPSLESIDSQAPSSPNAGGGGGGAGWDTEAEHILSFFLSGDLPYGGTSLPTFASLDESPHIDLNDGTDGSTGGEGGDENNHTADGAFSGGADGAGGLSFGGNSSSSGNRKDSKRSAASTTAEAEQRQPLDEEAENDNHHSNNNNNASSNVNNNNLANDDDDDDDLYDDRSAPPTPALHFYGSSAYSSSHHNYSSKQHNPQYPSPASRALGGYGGNPSINHPIPPVRGPFYQSQPRHPQQQQLQHQSQQQQHGPHISAYSQQHPQQQHTYPSHPNQQQPLAIDRQGSNSPMDHSPISPAGLIGAGHENLLLPPHNANSPLLDTIDEHSQHLHLSDASSQQLTIEQQQAIAAAAVAASNSNTAMGGPPHSSLTQQQLSEMSEQDRHRAWIRELNARAKAASSHGDQSTTNAGGATSGTTAVGAGASPALSATSAGTMDYTTMYGPHSQQQHHLVHQQHQYPPGSAAATTAASMGGMLGHAHFAAAQHHTHFYNNPAFVHAVAVAAGVVPGAGGAHADLGKPPVESAEKRAKRLERNRESARRSRRKKKERLETLEAQVNKLNGDIETERRKQINAMVKKLVETRHDAWNLFLKHQQKQQQQQQDNVAAEKSFWDKIIRATGSNSDIVRAVVEFQYTAMKQVVLPRYQKMLIWLAMQDDSYFTAGKEEYARRESNKKDRTSTGKISSKQIGEEIATGGVAKAPETKAPASKSKRKVSFKEGSSGSSIKSKQKEEEPTEQPQLVAYANDAARVWPLLCYDLAFSVDQEDRFLGAQKRARDMDDYGNRSQMAAAVQTSDRLEEAVKSLSRVVSQREEKSYYNILTPTQLLAYQKWLSQSQNRTLVTDVVRRTKGAESDTSAMLPNTDSSLHDICKRLDEVLQISKNEK